MEWTLERRGIFRAIRGRVHHSDNGEGFVRGARSKGAEIAPPLDTGIAMVFSRYLVLLLFPVFGLFACSSKPSAGGKCTTGTLACLDAKTGLFCGKDGTYESLSCRGSDGCKAAEGKVTCDQTVASVCDVCPGSVLACDTAMKSVLACTDGKFVPTETCKGAGTCKVGKGKNLAACEPDSTVATTGATVPAAAATGHVAPAAPAGGGKSAGTTTPANPAGPAPTSDPTGVSCPAGTKWGYLASSAFGDGRKNDGWTCITCDHGEKCPGCKGSACVGGSNAGGGGKNPATTPSATADSHGCSPNTVWSTQWNACVAR
jgi:hypothetical protein